MSKTKLVKGYELTAVTGHRYEAGGVETVSIGLLKRPTEEARFAMALVERWGLVVGEPDGEDSAGRSKLRALTSEELADKACDASQALYTKMDSLGWFFDIPDQEEIRDMRKSDEDDKSN